MPETIRGRIYLHTNEAAREIGVSRQTLLRWFREGRVSDVEKDGRGWRIFTKSDVARLRKWHATREVEDNASTTRKKK